MGFLTYTLGILSIGTFWDSSKYSLSIDYIVNFDEMVLFGYSKESMIPCYIPPRVSTGLPSGSPQEIVKPRVSPPELPRKILSRFFFSEIPTKISVEISPEASSGISYCFPGIPKKKSAVPSRILQRAPSRIFANYSFRKIFRNFSTSFF